MYAYPRERNHKFAIGLLMQILFCGVPAHVLYVPIEFFSRLWRATRCFRQPFLHLWNSLSRRRRFPLFHCSFLKADKAVSGKSLFDAIQDTEAFVAANDDVILVVFRGTSELTDWITNLSFRTRNIPAAWGFGAEDCDVHQVIFMEHSTALTFGWLAAVVPCLFGLGVLIGRERSQERPYCSSGYRTVHGAVRSNDNRIQVVNIGVYILLRYRGL